MCYSFVGHKFLGSHRKTSHAYSTFFYELSPTVLCLNHINLDFTLGKGGGGGGGGGRGHVHRRFMSKPYKFGYFTLGGIYPILLHPNTRDLYLLLFYTTVSLDFGCGPIFKLITHSPRMVNNRTMYPHSTQRDVIVHMKCKYVISCYVMLYA